MNEVATRNLYQKIEHRKSGLPDPVNEFLYSLELDRSIQTCFEYTKDIQLFLDFLIDMDLVNSVTVKRITLKDLGLITEKDIRLFIDYIAKYEKEFLTRAGNKKTQVFRNGPRGKERKRVTIYNLYQYFVERNQLQNNPVNRIRIKVDKYAVKSRLTNHEIAQIFDTALDNQHEYRRIRNYLMLKILAYTGIRISELTNLDISDIWLNRNEMVVTRKGGEQEAIYININIREDLTHYLDIRNEIKNVQKGHENALFLSQLQKRMDPRSVRKMIKVTSERAGIDIEVTPHTFRRTFGWNHYNRNKDLELTASVLGHSSLETTRQSYANADLDRMNKSLDDFDYK